MNEDTLKWIIASVVDKAKDAIEENKKDHTAFNEGLLEGYYEVLDVIKSRLIIDGAELKEFGLDFDLDSMESDSE